MNAFLFITGLLLIGVVVGESEVTAKKDKYCDKDQLEEVDLSYREIEEQRERRDNEFSREYNNIMEFLRDPGDHSGDVFDAFKASGTLLIIFLIILLISLIIYILLCCGFFKTNKNRVKIFTTLACIFFWIFLILYILILVFIGLSQNRI